MRKLFPTFKPGERKTNRAAAWASLSRAAQLGDGLRVSQGMYLARTEHGLHVGTYPPRVVTPIRKSAVFICGITVKPGDNDTTVSVREVRYKDGVEGPIADTDRPYEFAGDALDALPFPGRKAKEYADFVLSAPGPGDPAGALPLKPTDDYFEAFTFGDVVILGDIPSEGGTQTARFRIVGIGPDTVIADKLKVVDGVDVVDEPAMSIVRPWDLRRTPFDGKTIAESSYEYIDEETRLRKYLAGTRTLTIRERIFGAYANGVTITATKVGEETTGKVDHEWLDDNRAARRWARSFS